METILYKSTVAIVGLKTFMFTGVTGLFIYLDIDIERFLLFSIIMVVDTVFGCVKVLIINYKEFTIGKLLWGILIKLVTLSIPLVIALLVKALDRDINLILDIALWILIVEEGLSILGNIYTIKTGIKIQNINLVSYALISFRKSIIKFAKNKIDSFELKNGCSIIDNEEE